MKEKCLLFSERCHGCVECVKCTLFLFQCRILSSLPQFLVPAKFAGNSSKALCIEMEEQLDLFKLQLIDLSYAAVINEGLFYIFTKEIRKIVEKIDHIFLGVVDVKLLLSCLQTCVFRSACSTSLRYQIDCRWAPDKPTVFMSLLCLLYLQGHQNSLECTRLSFLITTGSDCSLLGAWFFGILL